MDNKRSGRAPFVQAPKNTLVMKFGGTSVGSVQALRNVAQIVRQASEEWSGLVVVVSALAGVTNLLLESAASAVRGDTAGIAPAEAHLRQFHREIANAVVTDPKSQSRLEEQISLLATDFHNLCQAIAILGEATPRALDAVASLGELMSVRLVAHALESAGIRSRFVEATELIVTDDCFQNAHPEFAVTRERTRSFLSPILAQKTVPVVTGFIAATPQGVTTTLGRGGSDFTAGILGAVLPAEEVWIWTDVDGVMSADPRAVPNAQSIPTLTYREIAELAYYGAKVLHPKTIRPVIETGIGLRILNTFNPGHPGTRLVADEAMPHDGEIKAVTAIPGQRLVTIEGRGMLGVPGVAARAFEAVASTGTSVPLITQASSEQSICFAAPTAATSQILAALEVTFANELTQRDIDSIWATEEVVIITVVGAGMIHTPGIAGRVFSALGRKGVNVIAIAQGSSEVSISLVVTAEDADQAVRALHTLIVPDADARTEG